MEAVKPKAVSHHITASAHQGGNFTAEKLPTITLKKIILLLDFEYPKDSAVAIDKHTWQRRTDSKRYSSRHVGNILSLQ